MTRREKILGQRGKNIREEMKSSSPFPAYLLRGYFWADFKRTRGSLALSYDLWPQTTC